MCFPMDRLRRNRLPGTYAHAYRYASTGNVRPWMVPLCIPGPVETSTTPGASYTPVIEPRFCRLWSRVLYRASLGTAEFSTRTLVPR